MTWRMPSPCIECPFNTKGPGAHLRKTLRAGRWRGILSALRRGDHFTCHKTANETGDGTNLMCAGAIKWQNNRGLSSNLQRVCERLDLASKVIR